MCLVRMPISSCNVLVWKKCDMEKVKKKKKIWGLFYCNLTTEYFLGNLT